MPSEAEFFANLFKEILYFIIVAKINGEANGKKVGQMWYNMSNEKS